MEHKEEAEAEVPVIEQKLHMLLHGMTDFKNPMSIMHTGAMMLNIALNMYSMVLSKEDLQELLQHTLDRVDNNAKDTVYH